MTLDEVIRDLEVEADFHEKMDLRGKIPEHSQTCEICKSSARLNEALNRILTQLKEFQATWAEELPGVRV